MLPEQTPRENQESELLRQFVAAYNFVLAAPAAALEPSVLALAFRLDHFSDMEMVHLLHG